MVKVLLMKTPAKNSIKENFIHPIIAKTGWLAFRRG